MNSRPASPEENAIYRGVEDAVRAAKRSLNGHADDASETTQRPEWPSSLDPAAFHGLAGDVVRMIEPHTEADPAAVLIQFLVAYGALVGREDGDGPHYRVEGDKHFANLYAVIVGPSSKGRKGTSWSRVRGIFERIPEWKPHVSGLSSGEGVKYHVRDAREEDRQNKHGETVLEIVDTGVQDKRLLVVESELASALRAAQRQGNTLSATLREGWDSGNLRTLTKHDPVVSTGAHICIIGHVTTDELRSELTQTDAANGFANRFLFCGAKRSKLLPFGGEEADEGELQALSDRVREQMHTARTRSRMRLTPAARSVWAATYKQLSEGHGGLHGAVTARAEAQTIRLALVYALLDGAGEINQDHLMAGLALWTYCDATAAHVFGISLGDRAADEIARKLRATGTQGMTRTDIRDLFQRNLSSERINVALDLLRSRGLAMVESVSGGGRSAEVWRAIQ